MQALEHVQPCCSSPVKIDTLQCSVAPYHSPLWPFCLMCSHFCVTFQFTHLKIIQTRNSCLLLLKRLSTCSPRFSNLVQWSWAMLYKGQGNNCKGYRVESFSWSGCLPIRKCHLYRLWAWHKAAFQDEVFCPTVLWALSMAYAKFGKWRLQVVTTWMTRIVGSVYIEESTYTALIFLSFSEINKIHVKDSYRLLLSNNLLECRTVEQFLSNVCPLADERG